MATPDALYLCNRQQGSWTCEKTSNDGTATDDPAAASLAAGVTGQGFVSAPRRCEQRPPPDARITDVEALTATPTPTD